LSYKGSDEKHIVMQPGLVLKWFMYIPIKSANSN